MSVKRRRITFCAAGYCFVAALAASPVLAQQSVPGAVRAGVREAVEQARSANFLAPPSIEQRVDAALTYLRAEGYYGADVQIVEAPEPSQNNSRVDFILELDNETRTLKVIPGPLFTLQKPDVQIDGPQIPEFVGAREQVNQLAQTLTNSPARASDVLRVQNQTLLSLREAGFTQATEIYPDIVVDHATASMAITYKLTTGPLTRFGEIVVTGAELTPPDWVTRAADVRSGAVATGERRRRIAERFRLTGAYQSVDLNLLPVKSQTSETAIADVELNLEERTRRTWSVGGEWSTSDGLGVDASTSFFHRFNRADTLTLDGRVGTLESSLGASLKLPSFRGAGRDLTLSARAGQETTDAFDRLIARLAATYILPRGRKDVLTYGLGIDVTRTEVPQNRGLGLGSRDTNGADFSALIRYERDRADDILNPTKGGRATGEVQPSIFVGEDQTIPYGRIVVTGTYYQPFSALSNGVIAARGKLGVLITDNDNLPFDRRFFAGGGGSVRGYAYQSIGPRDSEDNPLGGRSVIEAAIEARWSLRGPLGIAVFADAARVGALDFQDAQQTRIGAGIGLRYNLGIAPLRFDVAIPIDRRAGDPPVQLYISAGQSF